MKPQTAYLAIETSRCRSAALLSLAALFAVLWTGGHAAAQALVVTAPPHTTVVIFTDHPLPSGEWPRLLAAVRGGLADAAAETPGADPHAEVIRGDAVVPGLLVDGPVSVFLHGNCYPELQPHRYPGGETLGWVKRLEGRIDPFVHVDCTRIGQVLGPAISGMNTDQRSAAMAGAIARVILHEWIHIATQSAEHGRHGITKASFGVEDLIPDRDQLTARLRGLR